jgi:23S rRNA pseudouridine2604 synthase
MTEPLRLAKHVADLLKCSRREAELYIEGGYVKVDGVVVESPPFRVTTQTVEVDSKAKPAEISPTTVLLHKAAGAPSWDGQLAEPTWMQASTRLSGDRSGIRLLQKHLKEQVCVAPLEEGASGLVVFSQDWRIQRKLVTDRALVENEVIVEVKGLLQADQVQAMVEAQLRGSGQGAQAPLFKASISQQGETTTGLRFALKDNTLGRLARICQAQGWTIVGMKRLRVGRLSLAGLAPGQWRFLMPYERF